ncbi:MAG: hypothetical protein EBR30_13930 [Cytophagia bacterium]|nr:hypothetical protein [Cytophagia bacterium]NBW36091.1 hypothetical protein [Cytophagia bacterium]
MKANQLFFFIVLLFLSCSADRKYEVETHLDPLEREEQLWKIIRYIAKAPEGLLYEERFYPGYDSFYRHQLTRHRFEAYYIDKDRQHYFLVSRPAPSLVEKRVSTGGKMKFDEDGKLIEYEEVFRTWKMVPDTLKKRSMMLFDKMVKNEDLSPFYTKNSNGVDYIEFPDDINYYDKSGRRWRLKDPTTN